MAHGDRSSHPKLLEHDVAELLQVPLLDSGNPLAPAVVVPVEQLERRMRTQDQHRVRTDRRMTCSQSWPGRYLPAASRLY